MLDARKHIIPAGGDPTVSRTTIFDAFGMSINDIVPVANVTERAQVVAALTAAGQGPTAADPLIVSRADARGLHRIEYSYDGTVWTPASGVVAFSSVADATSWAQSNGSRLSAGDQCTIAGAIYFWNGSGWLPSLQPAQNATLDGGWTGQVSWARAGYTVTINVYVTGQNAWGPAAWGSVRIATGLPVPVSVIGTPATTNAFENSVANVEIQTNGDLRLVNRFQARSYGANSWHQATMTYLAAV